MKFVSNPRKYLFDILADYNFDSKEFVNGALSKLPAIQISFANNRNKSLFIGEFVSLFNSYYDIVDDVDTPMCFDSVLKKCIAEHKEPNQKHLGELWGKYIHNDFIVICEKYTK